MARTKKTAGQTATNPTILGTMRWSLIAARRLNNKKAISRDFVSGNPTIKDPDKAFELWCHTIADIYRVIEPWQTNFNNVGTEDSALQAVYDEVVPMWMALADNVDPNMFVRSNDVHRLLSFTLKHGSTGKGTVDVAVTMTEFRRQVEAMLGVRIAQGAVLTQDEHDTVKAYDKTVTNIDKAESKLVGTTKSDGTHKKGLLEDLEDAKKTYTNMADMVATLKVSDEQAEVLLKAYKDTVNDLETKIAKTKKTIEEYREYLSDNQKAYDAVMTKVNDIA